MKNETGINPLNDRVLVRPDVIAKKNSVGVLVDTKAALANEFDHKGEKLMMMKEADLWCKVK